MDFVVDVLLKSVSSLSRDEAITVMFEADPRSHRRWVGVCVVYHVTSSYESLGTGRIGK